ncbi:AAA family ATPase [Aerococcus urinae]|uniref:AAA family ATPase n=4 Tax=Bacillati TaxID=1783272 RepID=A0A1E9PGW3_9LACT|nr:MULTISPECIES: AAA family ATPase [Aerococcus]KAA9291229.1 AAA family ATPase [Aerococcus mictus]MBU5611150.1 AAA family ATPase [Aerococcus urinae]MCY3064942.1 AAA family ATPase [Aerococcus mictus]MCY3077335.1 AAA family ATPase [Aerococcus mictus]MCY3081434.1 AAA family ATPase [Aerococcus mictus]
MKILKAEEIKRLDAWTALIYSEPGKGKTYMVRSLKGNTLVLSVDGMYQVLEGLPNVTVLYMDADKPNEELENFLKFLIKHVDHYDNVVIDNLSTFQKFWLNERARKTTSGMPELKDYGVFDRIILELISELKNLQKNLLFLAHEKDKEITRESGGVYTQKQPDVRNLDACMGIIPLVGRLVMYKNSKDDSEERIIILQPSESTRAKDQLLGDRKAIKQMELLPLLQEQEGED